MRKWLVPALVVVAVAAFVLWRFSPGTQTPTVVVYVSHDQVFSEPILKDFEKETGIKVRADLRYRGDQEHGHHEPAHCREEQSAGGCLLGE